RSWRGRSLQRRGLRRPTIRRQGGAVLPEQSEGVGRHDPPPLLRTLLLGSSALPAWRQGLGYLLRDRGSVVVAAAGQRWQLARRRRRRRVSHRDCPDHPATTPIAHADLPALEQRKPRNTMAPRTKLGQTNMMLGTL